MKGELQYIGRHAGTVLAGQLAVMAFGTTDTIVASRYSNEAVAALSVGSAIFISVYASLMGIFQALLPLWSEQRGAGRPRAIGHSLRQSMYLCATACVLGMAVLLMPDALLRWTDVPDALQLEVKRYLAVLAWGLPPALLFRIYSALNQSLGHPKLVTWLQLISLLIKIPLSVWFTFGGLGLAPLGAVGCALATLLVNYTMFAVALWLMRTQDFYAPLALWQKLEPLTGGSWAVSAALAFLRVWPFWWKSPPLRSWPCMWQDRARSRPPATRLPPIWPPSAIWCRCPWPLPPVPASATGAAQAMKPRPER